MKKRKRHTTPHTMQIQPFPSHPIHQSPMIKKEKRPRQGKGIKTHTLPTPHSSTRISHLRVTSPSANMSQIPITTTLVIAIAFVIDGIPTRHTACGRTRLLVRSSSRPFTRSSRTHFTATRLSPAPYDLQTRERWSVGSRCWGRCWRGMCMRCMCMCWCVVFTCDINVALSAP